MCVTTYLFEVHILCEGYLDAAADGDHRWLSGRGGDGDGAHLVVEAIVVSVVHHKVEDVGDGLDARLQGSDVPADQDIHYIHLQ